MNYRHAFHAGNFADLVKHAILLLLIERLTLSLDPLVAVDTHAGAGAYDLQGEAAAKSGEAQAGILRLMEDAQAPAAFSALKQAVIALNGGGPVRFYPGSPSLIAGALRPTDHYLACELRSDDHATLQQALKPYDFATARQADGYAAAPGALEPKRRALVLIDPPFEAADDYERIAGAVAAILSRQPRATIAVWVPLKDLETFDARLRRLEDAGVSDMLVAEARLRRLIDPLKMNGCAMLLVGAPAGLDHTLTEVVQWVARKLGNADGLGRVWRPAG